MLFHHSILTFEKEVLKKLKNEWKQPLYYFISQLSIVVHEIGHAIGLFHEQMRSDRDEHVIINWQNIYEDTKSNFVKEEQFEHNKGVPYDYTSIMHYDGKVGVWCCLKIHG